MSDPQQIEKDLREYLEKEPNLRKDDRLAYLKVIFGKYFAMSQIPHSINYRDVQEIIDGAKRQFTNARLPMHVSGKKIEGQELVNVAVIESTVSYLNKHSLLKKLAKLDHTS